MVNKRRLRVNEKHFYADDSLTQYVNISENLCCGNKVIFTFDFCTKNTPETFEFILIDLILPFGLLSKAIL